MIREWRRGPWQRYCLDWRLEFRIARIGLSFVGWIRFGWLGWAFILLSLERIPGVTTA